MTPPKLPQSGGSWTRDPKGDLSKDVPAPEPQTEKSSAPQEAKSVKSKSPKTEA